MFDKNEFDHDAKCRVRRREVVWTDEHKRWAVWAQLRLAAELSLSAETRVTGIGLAHEPGIDVRTEAGWRKILRGYVGLGAARIDAEVRRVDAIAMGRLVREEAWQVRIDGAGPIACDDRVDAERTRRDIGGGYLVRVRRLRRARHEQNGR